MLTCTHESSGVTVLLQRTPPQPQQARVISTKHQLLTRLVLLEPNSSEEVDACQVPPDRRLELGVGETHTAEFVLLRMILL